MPERADAPCVVMNASAHDCPFLNRTDARCGEHFTLDQLDHAFAYCFGEYETCPLFAQRLAERRDARHALGEAPNDALVAASALANAYRAVARAHSVVQVNVRRAYA